MALLHSSKICPCQDSRYDEIDSVADMLEARAHIPTCKRLECLELNCWFDRASLAARGRLLRVLLPSVVELQTVTWNRAFESCFLEARAPYLKCVIIFLENEQVTFSWNMLAAAPALASVNIFNNGWLFEESALQVVTAASRHGALQNLQNIVLYGCHLKDGDVKDFLVALEESGCAKQVERLCLDNCEVDNNGVHALADFLCRGAFPSLKGLKLPANSSITDVGVVALAEALLTAPQSMSRNLDLHSVRMGDKGIAASTALVSHGSFKQLEGFMLSEHVGVTNEGIILLARAISAYGLPLFKAFKMECPSDQEKITFSGIATISLAVINGCPKLQNIDEDHSTTLNEIVGGMLQVAGRDGDVEFGEIDDLQQAT